MSEQIFLKTLPKGPGGPWPDVAVRFAELMDALIEAVCPTLTYSRTWPGVSVALWLWLQRVVIRFAGTAVWALAQAAKAAAKRAPQATNRAPARPGPRRRRPPDPDNPPPVIGRPPPPRRKLPKDFAWLLQAVPATSAQASALAAFLAEPETAALLARSASLSRLLVPLCRMLAVEPPARGIRPSAAAAPSFTAPGTAPSFAPPDGSWTVRPAAPPAAGWASPAAPHPPDPGPAPPTGPVQTIWFNIGR